MLTNRFKNRVRRVMYRPSRRRRQAGGGDTILHRLEEVEGTLLMLLGKNRKRIKK